VALSSARRSLSPAAALSFTAGVPGSSRDNPERGEMLGIYAGLGVSLFLALVFARADRRRH
jgi:hypothetical protein